MASTAKIDTLKTINTEDNSTQIIYPVTSTKAVLDENGVAIDEVFAKNSFSKFVIDGTTVEAETIADAITLVAGENVVLTPDVENNSLTIESLGGGDFTVTKLTQAEYNALSEEEKNTGAYLITDANSGGGTGGASSAEELAYDNTASGLVATNVQDAIDEVVSSSGGSSVNEWDGTLEEFEALPSVEADTNYYIATAEGMNLGLSFFPDYTKPIREFNTRNDSWVATEDCCLVGQVLQDTAGFAAMAWVDNATIATVYTTTVEQSQDAIFVYVKKGQTVNTGEYGTYVFNAYALQYSVAQGAGGGSSAPAKWQIIHAFTLDSGTSYAFDTSQYEELYIVVRQGIQVNFSMIIPVISLTEDSNRPYILSGGYSGSNNTYCHVDIRKSGLAGVMVRNNEVDRTSDSGIEIYGR